MRKMSDKTGHFKDSLVFIYNKNNELITKTSVTGHDAGGKTIEVAEGLEKVEPRTRLQLLIYHSGGASELKGILKESRRPGIFEILVYDEKKKDLRVSIRRTLNAPAVISDMIVDPDAGGHNTDIPDAPPPTLPVTIENMSVSGILITSGELRLQIGTLLQIELIVSKKTGILYGEVLREQARNDGTFSYGCQLYFFNDG
jgi:hypothetical protein